MGIKQIQLPKFGQYPRINQIFFIIYNFVRFIHHIIVLDNSVNNPEITNQTAMQKVRAAEKLKNENENENDDNKNIYVSVLRFTQCDTVLVENNPYRKRIEVDQTEFAFFLLFNTKTLETKVFTRKETPVVSETNQTFKDLIDSDSIYNFFSTNEDYKCMFTINDSFDGNNVPSDNHKFNGTFDIEDENKATILINECNESNIYYNTRSSFYNTLNHKTHVIDELINFVFRSLVLLSYQYYYKNVEKFKRPTISSGAIPDTSPKTRPGPGPGTSLGTNAKILPALAKRVGQNNYLYNNEPNDEFDDLSVDKSASSSRWLPNI